MNDHNSLGVAMQEIFISYFADISRVAHTCPTFDLRRLSDILEARGPLGVLAFLEKHRKVLLEYFRTGKIIPKDVKNAHGVPIFCGTLWQGLLLEGARNKQRRVVSAFALHQLFSLFRKAQLDCPSGPALEDFVRRQECRGSEISWDLVDKAAMQLEAWGFRDIVPDDLKPYVSTGATYAKTPVLERLNAIARCELTKDGLGRIKSAELAQRNRAACVPKTWSAPRVIFVEFAHQMLLQQSLRKAIEAQCSARIPNRTRFDEQQFQRDSLRLPNRSSIDLSNASDELLSTVVWRFLRGLPRLRAALFAARSTQCEVKGFDPTPLKCFGTMGNATTFPVMTLFLCALTGVIERESRQFFGEHGVRGVRILPSTVFGDDIVCDDIIAGSVIDALRRVGLIRNASKTFVASAFKESCGLDLFEGLDITPTYLKKIHCSGIKSKLAAIAAHNAFERRGLTHTAACIRRAFSLEKFPVNWNCEHSLVRRRESPSRGNAIYHSQEQRWLSPLFHQLKDEYSFLEVDSDAHLDYWLANKSRVRQAAF